MGVGNRVALAWTCLENLLRSCGSQVLGHGPPFLSSQQQEGLLSPQWGDRVQTQAAASWLKEPQDFPNEAGIISQIRTYP